MAYHENIVTIGGLRLKNYDHEITITSMIVIKWINGMFIAWNMEHLN